MVVYFIRQCHVLGLAEKRLKSIIKRSQYYSVQGIIYPTGLGHEVVQNELLIMKYPAAIQHHLHEEVTHCCSKVPSSSQHEVVQKKERNGKGIHALIMAKRLLQDKENWKTVSSKSEYHFPGVFTDERSHIVYYIPDYRELPQASSDLGIHFLWDDIQLSKSSWNKDREVHVSIGENNEVLLYRASSCNGVKVCPTKGCSFVAPVSAQRPCQIDPEQNLIRTSTTESCPVVFAYMYPKDIYDHRRWMLVFRRQESLQARNIHNHVCTVPQKYVPKLRKWFLMQQASMQL